MIDTPPDTPEHDVAARNLAERIFSAYAQQASGPMHPQHEQALLARLAEALRPRIGGQDADLSADLAAAANAALDAWEQAAPETRGPRVAAVDAGAQTVTLARAR